MNVSKKLFPQTKTARQPDAIRILREAKRIAANATFEYNYSQDFNYECEEYWYEQRELAADSLERMQRAELLLDLAEKDAALLVA